MLPYIRNWLLTVVIESAVLYLLKVRDKEDYLLMLLVNLVTNIPANVLYQLNLHYNIINRWLRMALIEVTVTVIEYIYIKKYMKSDADPLITAIAINAASFLGGMVWSLFTEEYWVMQWIRVRCMLSKAIPDWQFLWV